MSLLKALEAIRNPFLDTVCLGIAEIVSEYLFIIAAVVLFWCVSKTKGYYIMITCFLSLLANNALKVIFRVPRPWVLHPQLDTVEAATATATGYSFPSGHTQSITSLMGGISRCTESKAIRIASAVVIFLTAFSRLYLGVHTIWDVSVGLAVAIILVFAMYPLIKDVEEYPDRMHWVMAGIVAVSAAYTLYVSLFPFPADIDPANLAEAVKTSWVCLGISLGIVVTYYVDRGYTRFPTEAVWWAQILKCVIGLALVLGVKALLKGPLLAMFGGHPSADCVRYFIVMVIAGAIWPMTFKYWAKLGRK